MPACAFELHPFPSRKIFKMALSNGRLSSDVANFIVTYLAKRLSRANHMVEEAP